LPVDGSREREEVDWLPMDPRDRLQPFANGVDCAVCGGLVPIDRIRILARRDDLAFLELACAACKSESLGIVVADGADGSRSNPVYGEFQPADAARFRHAPRIDADDLLAARELLRRGGLDALVGRAGNGQDQEPA
jgi:hypothetical protein